MALRFAEAQYRAEPKNPAAILVVAKQWRLAGKHDAACAVLAFVFGEGQSLQHIPSNLLRHFVRELVALSSETMAKRAAQEMLARNANDQTAANVLRTMHFIEAHGKPGRPLAKAGGKVGRLGPIMSWAKSLVR